MKFNARISLEFLLLLVFICVMILLLCQLSEIDGKGEAIERHEALHIEGLNK